MFCPKCKYEYEEGHTKCSDCGVSLVAPKEKKIKHKENENKWRGWTKLLYFICLILLVIIGVYINDYADDIVNKLFSLVIFLYLVGGSILSFYFQLPIFGTFSSLFETERSDFDTSNVIANILVIVASVIFEVSVLTE